MAANRIPLAVVFDAFGTLVTLDDPVGRLRRGLADAGYEEPPDVVAVAFRREVAHYRRHQDRGRDERGLEALRRECAAVFADALTTGPPVDDARAILLGALRFRVFADVVIALDVLAGAGLRLGVVSNWDCSLGGVLDEVGIGDRFEVVSASAVVGARKPDPAIFRHALAALELEPERVVHVGDSIELDIAGAEAAGIRGLLIDRDADPGRPRVLSTLAELPHRLGLC